MASDDDLRFIVQRHSILQAHPDIVDDLIRDMREAIADEIHALGQELVDMAYNEDDPYDVGHSEGLGLAEKFARYGTLYPEEANTVQD